MIRLGIIADAAYIGPHGLTCMDCEASIEPGMEAAERLSGMVDDIPLVEIICGACGRSATSQRDGDG